MFDENIEDSRPTIVSKIETKFKNLKFRIISVETGKVGSGIYNVVVFKNDRRIKILKVKESLVNKTMMKLKKSYSSTGK